MNPSLFSPFRTLIVALACVAAPLVHAVPLDFDVSGLAHYTPASKANNNPDATNAVNDVIDWYNGGANPNGGIITFTLDVGTGVPAPQLPAAVFGFKDDNKPFGDIDSSVYTYALGKYGENAYILYLGNLAPGSYSMPTNLGGHDLSHFLAFTATRTTSVPDGGTTMALLGLGLLFLEGVRRRLKLA